MWPVIIIITSDAVGHKAQVVTNKIYDGPIMTAAGYEYKMAVCAKVTVD